MKRLISFFRPLYAAMLLACMGLAACGGDDGNGGGNGSDSAPSNVKGKEFGQRRLRLAYDEQQHVDDCRALLLLHQGLGKHR